MTWWTKLWMRVMWGFFGFLGLVGVLATNEWVRTGSNPLSSMWSKTKDVSSDISDKVKEELEKLKTTAEKKTADDAKALADAQTKLLTDTLEKARQERERERAQDQARIAELIREGQTRNVSTSGNTISGYVTFTPLKNSSAGPTVGAANLYD